MTDAPASAPLDLREIARQIAAAVVARVMSDGDPARPLENIVYHEALSRLRAAVQESPEQKHEDQP